MSELTHVDEHGDAHMVEVGDKEITRRTAIAEGSIRISREAMDAVVQRTAKKGDVLTVAQIAGIQGAKRTSELIPLCHPLPLTGIDLELVPAPEEGLVRCRATVRCTGRTGVEMEALTAVTVALLTVYDMLKAVDKTMELGEVRVVEKHGGKHGSWLRHG